MVIELTSVGDSDLQVNHSLLFVQAQPGPVASTDSENEREIIAALLIVVVVDDDDDLKKKVQVISYKNSSTLF